jgi:hypothetical protein
MPGKGTVKCPDGHENETGQRFCGECGKPIEQVAPTSPSITTAGEAVAEADNAETVPLTVASPKEGTGWASKPRLFLVGGVAILVVAVVAAVLVASSSGGTSADDAYLAALKKGGYSSQFSSNANAIAAGKQVCRQLNGGGKEQGSAADRVAVVAYCPNFLQGFHILQHITVRGLFTLKNSTPNDLFPEITTLGTGCQGASGFSDIQPGTAVIIKNGTGTLLTQTTLGPGIGSSSSCVFAFSFDVTEGEDQYVITISHRGDLSYTFDQLKAGLVGASLGN